MRASCFSNSLLVLSDGVHSTVITLRILEVMHPPRIALRFFLSDRFASRFLYFLKCRKNHESVLRPRMKGGTYRNHFLDVINIKVQQIALAGPTTGVFIRFNYSSSKVLELFIGKAEHCDIVSRVLRRQGLEGPVENAAVEFLGYMMISWI